MRYIYSRLVTCEKCSRTMHAKNMHYKSRRDGSKQIVPALCCPGCGRWLSFAKLDKAFQQWRDDFFATSDEGDSDVRVDTQHDKVAELQGELTRVAKEKNRLITLFTSELIELTEHKERLTQYQQRELMIDNELQQLSTELQQEQQHDEALLQLAELFQRTMSTLSTAEVNAVYRGVLRVAYTVDKRVDIQLM